MKTFFLLVKINIINMFNASASKSKKKWPIMLFMGFVFIYIMASISIVAYSLGKGLSSVGLTSVLAIMGILSSTMMILFFSIFSTFPFVFKCKDYDMTSAMPISSAVVFLSKLVAHALILYLYAAVTFVPFIIMYFVFTKITAIAIISAIIVFLLLPFVPILIGLIVGMIINIIPTSTKFGKIVNIVFMITMLGVIMFFSMNPDALSAITTSEISSVMNNINAIYFVSSLATSAITSGNLLSLLLFILVSLVPILIFTLILSRYYKPLYNFYNRTIKTKIKKDITFKRSSVLKALIGKEFGRLFSSTSYFLNSCLGPMLFVVVSVAFLFMPMAVTGSVDTALKPTILSFILMFNLMASPLAVTFSMEGNAFYLIKSSPINVKDYIISKVLMQTIIFLPLMMAGTILLSIASKFNILTSILLIVLTIPLNALCAFFALLLAKKHYNLHYTNEIQVVKQSTAVLFQVLISIGAIVFVNMIFAIVEKFIAFELFIGILILLITCISAILGYKVFKTSNYQLNEIE